MLLGIAMGALMLVGAEPLPDETKERTLAVVVHVDNELESISRLELARIFMKQQTTWPDGQRCIPIDQRGDSPIRRSFSELVLQRSVYVPEIHDGPFAKKAT